MLYIALLCLTGALQATSQTRTPDQVAANAAAFSAATQTNKVATLNRLAAHELSLPTDDVVDIVLAGMTDQDAGVRVAALGAAGGRLAAARFSASANPAAPVDRPLVHKLRSPLLSALNDRTPKARQLATIALVNLEYESGSRTGAIKLDDEVAQALASQYAVDQSALVRIEIATTFVLMDGPETLRESVLARALDDADATVVSYGVVGLGKSKPASALEPIVQLLRHSERNVRLQAAQALVPTVRRPRVCDTARGSGDDRAGSCRPENPSRCDRGDSVAMIGTSASSLSRQVGPAVTELRTERRGCQSRATLANLPSWLSD